MFNKNNAWAIEGDAQIKLDVNMTLSEAVALGATLIAKLNKGYKLVDQFSKPITKERVLNMINTIANRCNNVLSNEWIIKLSTVFNKTGRYTDKQGNVLKTNMGAIHAQLINLKGLYEKIEYQPFYVGYLFDNTTKEVLHQIGVYDEEFRSSGLIDVKELETTTIYRCLLNNNLTIITDNVELFNSYYDYGVYKPSIVKCYSSFIKFVYVESLNDLKNEPNILYKLGATINTCVPKQNIIKYSHDENRVEILNNLFGYTVTGEETPKELDEIVKYFCNNFESSVDITKGYNYLHNLTLPTKIKTRLDIYLNKLVQEGKLNATDDSVYYEDSNADEEYDIYDLYNETINGFFGF